MPGKFLVDTIPIRTRPNTRATPTVTKKLMKPWTVQYLPDWFPGTGFKALAKEVREKYQISLDGPMEYVKEAMKVSL